MKILLHAMLRRMRYDFSAYLANGYMNHPLHHIYFADDDPDDHLVFTTAFEETFPEMTLHSFYHCSELLALLNDEGHPLPDLVFLDLNMPGNEKFECLRAIKQAPRLKTVEVVIYTTSNYYKDADEALRNGAFRYVHKPSSFTELKSILKELLSPYSSTDN